MKTTPLALRTEATAENLTRIGVRASMRFYAQRPNDRREALCWLRFPPVRKGGEDVAEALREATRRLRADSRRLRCTHTAIRVAQKRSYVCDKRHVSRGECPGGCRPEARFLRPIFAFLSTGPSDPAWRVPPLAEELPTDAPDASKGSRALRAPASPYDMMGGGMRAKTSRREVLRPLWP
jgi:hypothetical protein